MSDIPPKHTPDTTAYDTPETGSGLVAMYNAASHANAESFPVLKAFQEYIEAERAQARKRVIQLSVFFSILMGVVVTGFLIAGIFMLRNMTTVQNKLLDVALANTVHQNAPVPTTVAPTILPQENSLRDMSRLTSDLKNSIDQKLDGVSAITTKVHDKLTSQDNEMEKLRAELLQMQKQSAQLKDEMLAMKTLPAPAVAAPVITYTAPPNRIATPDANASLNPRVVAIPAPPAPTPPVVVATVPAPTSPPVIAPKDTPVPPQPLNLKAPPSVPTDVTPPAPPSGMIATTIPMKTKNSGTIPWHVLIPE